jgi:hypothetical protein
MKYAFVITTFYGCIKVVKVVHKCAQSSLLLHNFEVLFFVLHSQHQHLIKAWKKEF